MTIMSPFLLTSLYQIRGPNRPGDVRAIRPPGSVHEEVLPVGTDRDQPVEVGAEDGGVAVLEAGQHVFIGVTEGVFEAVRYQRDGGCDGVQKGLDGGRFRSMMGDFQDVGVEILTL